MKKYDKDTILRRRAIKRTLICLGLTGAVIVGSTKFFNISGLLKNRPKNETVQEDDTKPEIEIYDEPVVTDYENDEIDTFDEPVVTDYENDEIENIVEEEEIVDIEEDNLYDFDKDDNIDEFIDYEETEEYDDTYENELENSHIIDLAERTNALVSAYSTYVPMINNEIYNPSIGTTYSNEDLQNIIDFINGDYEVHSREEAIAMRENLLNFYTVLLCSDELINRVNDGADYRIEHYDEDGEALIEYERKTSSDYIGRPFNADLAEIMITNKNNRLQPLLEYIGYLHNKVLSSNDINERREAALEVDHIIGSLCYGAYEYNGSYYSLKEFEGKENIAQASLLESYIFDLLPFLSNIGESNSSIISNFFNVNGSFYSNWENNLIDANMDGQYSYTIK